MPSYKLIYFQTRGRGETARLIFKQAGVEFEDVRLSRDEWLQYKPNTPYETLPVLEVDGKQLAGSRSIQRYLAEEFGLAGSNAFENAYLDSIIDVCYDLEKEIIKYFIEKDDTKKAEIKKQMVDEHLPKYLGIFEKLLKANDCPDGWVFGSKVTYADMVIYNYLSYIKLGFSGILDQYPAIQKNMTVIESLPNIAKWFKERPESSH